MAATKEDICNSALSKLGAEPITLITDSNRRARLCNEQFEKLRKRILRGHPWNFAIKRESLARIKDTTDSVVFATDTFTSKGAVALNLITGSRVTLSLVSGTLPEPLQENLAFFVIKITGTTFKLAESVENATAGTALDILDAPTFEMDLLVGPPFEFEASYTQPTDMLRAIREESKRIDWKVEGQLIVTNEVNFNLLYIADITDVTLFDESFDELFALELAHELAFPMNQSMTLKQQLAAELALVKRDMRSFDAQEGRPERFEADEWLLSRKSSFGQSIIP